MKQLSVIKVGGAIVEDEETLNQLLHSFAAIKGPKVLVHGGGRSATRIASDLGIESQMVGGRRITDEAMLRVVTMVYGGLVNKNVVARLHAVGVNALGLTGADMDIIHSHRRPVGEVDYGWVGDVDRVDGRMLSLLLEQNVVPVMAPLTHDGNGHLLNTNADTIAAQVAQSLTPYYNVTLTYCFERPGVLLDPNDDGSVIPDITETQFHDYVQQGVIAGGMIPKLENSFHCISRGVSQVIITRHDDLQCERGTILRGT